jgi:hypothetical protein
VALVSTPTALPPLPVSQEEDTHELSHSVFYQPSWSILKPDCDITHKTSCTWAWLNHTASTLWIVRWEIEDYEIGPSCQEHLLVTAGRTDTVANPFQSKRQVLYIPAGSTPMCGWSMGWQINLQERTSVTHKQSTSQLHRYSFSWAKRTRVDNILFEGRGERGGVGRDKPLNWILQRIETRNVMENSGFW